MSEQDKKEAGVVKADGQGALEAVGGNSGISFDDAKSFEHLQRVAKVFSQSSLVPDTFRGKMSECIIALEMAHRIGASPLAVMQNIYIVHGKPAWSSQFLISCVNACGKFSPLRYEMTEGDTACVAWAYDLLTKEKLRSPKITMAMANAEGWVSKSGSKWKTMPDLMLRYRAATLFARTYCPELTMGIQTKDEVIDVTDAVVVSTPQRPRSSTSLLNPVPTVQGDGGNPDEADGMDAVGVPQDGALL